MDSKVLVVVLVSVCLLTIVAGQAYDDKNCEASNGSVCNDQGKCSYGICTCTKPYAGVTCEECPNCPNSCAIYGGCVSCKIFGTGPLGVLECLNRCEYIGNYIPVSKEEFDVAKDDNSKLCIFRNKENCQESFRIGGMSEGYRDLYVRTEMECFKEPLKTTTTLTVIDVGTVDVSGTTEDNDVTYTKGQKESAGAAAGAGKITDDGTNGASNNLKESVTCLIVITSILNGFAFL